jgi:GxxExxY protein
VERQKEIDVFYDEVLVGQFYADLVVENSVILELKAVPVLETRHFSQCMNYLKATNLNLGLLINFGTPSVEIRRVVRDF